jgi:hypothetical protein
MSWHRPWEQAWVRVSHLMPQPPQFSSSVRMFVQDPSQHSWFALHCHSQLPQWLRLLFVSTQKLLQAIMPSSSRQHPSIVQTSSPGAILRAGRVARTAPVRTDAPVAALAHAARAPAGARLGVELLAAAALLARTFAFAGALVALMPWRTRLLGTPRLLLLFLRLGQRARSRGAGQHAENAAGQQAHDTAAGSALAQSPNHIVKALLVHLLLLACSLRSRCRVMDDGSLRSR